jgi:hypothetical protein
MNCAIRAAITDFGLGVFGGVGIVFIIAFHQVLNGGSFADIAFYWYVLCGVYGGMGFEVYSMIRAYSMAQRLDGYIVWERR